MDNNNWEVERLLEKMMVPVKWCAVMLTVIWLTQLGACVGIGLIMSGDSP